MVVTRELSKTNTHKTQTHTYTLSLSLSGCMSPHSRDRWPLHVVKGKACVRVWWREVAGWLRWKEGIGGMVVWFDFWVELANGRSKSVQVHWG